MKSDFLKNVFLWAIILLILATVFNTFGPKQTTHQKMSYSQFVQEMHEGKVASVTIAEKNITGMLQDNKPFATYIPLADDTLLPTLIKSKVDVTGKPLEKPFLSGFIGTLIINVVLFLILFGIIAFIMRQQMGSGRGGAFSFGRSRARLLSNGQVKVTFADVAGCEEAKEDVSELVEFLRDPGKFQRLGGRIPRGVLLMGQPGTGKTLIAKAVAGEAKVPFFSISGSDFVEMFVGVGASRVRDMFEQAKKQAPCIVFIDELDAVGRHRGTGLGGGHDEREQTLNQLLVEMDGFEQKAGVIVLAATNRPDVLDPALLRPGRFDRQVVVPLPDIRGREQILVVHAKKVATASNVHLDLIARGTPGMSGADLANLVNEAALIAARANKPRIHMEDFEKAKDKLLMGSERRSMVMSEEERRLTAYHEAGHAIVGRSLPSHDPIYKVTIIPRGRALGVTMFLPEQDRYNLTKEHIESRIAALFGGRIAEAMVFGQNQITTGAANDIERATELVRNMVTRWGFSEALGPLVYGEEQGEIFLGQALATRHKELSDYTAQLIDKEIRVIVDRNYEHAKKLLADHIGILHKMAEALIKYETLDSNQIDDLMAGKTVQPPEGWHEGGHYSVSLKFDESADESASKSQPSSSSKFSPKGASNDPTYNEKTVDKTSQRGHQIELEQEQPSKKKSEQSDKD